MWMMNGCFDEAKEGIIEGGMGRKRQKGSVYSLVVVNGRL
jgi:hypothetical protein